MGLIDPQLIRAEFRRRQEEQRSISWKAAPALAALLAAEYLLPCPLKRLVLYGVIIYVCYILYLSWRNWRCPACEKYLGKAIKLDRCPHCHTEF